MQNRLFTLSTDTACDIYRNELRERGIEYIPIHYTTDGVEKFDEFTSDEQIKEFYDKIRGGEMPTTSQITMPEYEVYFGKLLEKYDGDIVHVTISSGITSSPLFARQVASNIFEETGRRIYIIDSLGATIASRHIVDEAERLRDSGVNGEQAEAQLNDYVNHIHTWFMPLDLMHLKRGGRVSGPSAYIGTALNIKPILKFNAEGKLEVVSKKIGASKGIAEMISIFARDAAEGRKVYIASADSELADGMLKKACTARPDCTAEVRMIGPVIGSHTGSSAVGISFYSEKLRSEV